MKELLTRRTSHPKEFRSLLEHILFKGAFFDLPATNVCRNSICLNHIEELMSTEGNRGRCTTCKPICKRQTASNNASRRVSRNLALAIWEHGQPNENWAFYDKPICDQCRKYLTDMFVNEEIRSKCGHIFGNEQSNVQ